MKSRASFTIESDVLARLDSIVDNIYYKSKSEAVEDIIRKFFERQHTAIILCGGDFTIQGTDTYRPLVKIGESTLIERTLSNLRSNNFRSVFISGNTNLLKKIFPLLKNGEGYGIDVKYVDDNNLKGSAKALERVRKYIGSTTLFLPGDAMFDIDLKDMIKYHISNNSIASIAISVSGSAAESVNDKLVLKGNKVVSYERLKSPIISKLVPTTIIALERDVYKYIPPGDMEWDIRQDMLPLIAKEGNLFGYTYNGQWMRIKTKQDVEKARKIFK